LRPITAVDQLKPVWQIRECLRRCRQGLVNRAVIMRNFRLSLPIQFPAYEENKKVPAALAILLMSVTRSSPEFTICQGRPGDTGHRKRDHKISLGEPLRYPPSGIPPGVGFMRVS
jgi:hypothetical protein